MQLTADEVLHIFHHDEINFFLGAAFATAGLISLSLLAIRRKFDALFFWLGFFAILYGGRLWMETDLMQLMVPPSEFFPRLKLSSDLLVAIPAFFFFRATGLLGKAANVIAYTATVAQILLLLADMWGEPISLLYNINSLIVIGGLIILTVQSFRHPALTRDLFVIRGGLLVFVGFALWTNVQDILGIHIQVEQYGFLVLLVCLGYVSARRVLEKDKQLYEIQQELDIAKRIQLSILPEEFPASANFRVAARYVPMRAVAGDYYDFLIADDARAGLLVADVSGHGVPAALIASMVKMAATSQRNLAGSPSELLAAMNTALCGNTQRQYVTAAYVYLDGEQRELRYAAAAHPPMLLLRKGQVSRIEENGLMLALFAHAPYSTKIQKLEPGDRLLLYTDGIIEAANSTAEEFGLERLSAILRESAKESHTKTLDRIIDSVQRWAASQEDDLTVLVCDYIGGA